MRIIDPDRQPREEWRLGVTTRMQVSLQLCIFEQWCEPGKGAPAHWHAVEEVLSVLEGQADVWIEQECATVTSGRSILVPASRRHGFHNSGSGILHMRAVLAAPIFEASFEDRNEVSLRWLPIVPTARSDEVSAD